MIDIAHVLTIVSILFGAFIAFAGVVKWLSGRIDEEVSDIQCRLDNSSRITQKQIDEIKDHYVRRVDLDRDLTNLYAMLNGIKDDIRDQTREMNDRLDRLLRIFADRRD